MANQINKPYYQKRSAKPNDHWFQRNESYWTFGATLISAVALIVSIIVMLDQRDFSKKQIEYAKTQMDSSNKLAREQYILAKAQFDSTLTDKAKAEIEDANTKSHQDSIFNIQYKISKAQLKIKNTLPLSKWKVIDQ